MTFMQAGGFTKTQSHSRSDTKGYIFQSLYF